MKRVTENKRKFSKIDIPRFFGVLLLHYVSLWAYALIFLLIRYYFVTDQGFLIPFKIENWLWLWIVFVLPLMNFFMHVFYIEKGQPSIRLMMWIHLAIAIFLIPIVIFET